MIFNCVIPLLFFILALVIMPLDRVFQFDTDEGIQLIKASLYSQGFHFDVNFWNDQPLFFTIFLAKCRNFLPDSIVNVRLLFVSFTTLLIWSFANILRVCVGNIPAIIGTFLLVISYNFMRLSASVMIGIPALSLAMLSIYTIILYQQKRELYLILISGLSLALSLQIKFFTIFLLPLILLFLLITEKWQLKHITIWLIGFITVFLVTIFTNLFSLEQVFEFHINNKLKSTFIYENSFKDVLIFYLQDLDYLLLAIIGFKQIKLDFKENLINYIPLIWLTLATILLLNHKPIWYHHYLLISIPLTWLAIYGVKQLLPYFKRKKWYFQIDFAKLKQDKISKFTTGCLIFSLCFTPVKIGVTLFNNHLLVKNSQPNFEVVNNILAHKNKTNWLFTDVAMYAYYSKIKIPPEIAVLSRKRLANGDLNQEKLIQILEKYHPEQVVLERFPEIEKDISPYLEQHYNKIFEIRKVKHYLRK